MAVSIGIGVAVSIAIGVYLALLVVPSPVFAHSVRAGNVVLHASEPFSPNAQAVATEVLRRVQRSPFFVVEQSYEVYLCASPECFQFFSPFNARAGAVSHVGLFGNIFVRPSQIERDRLIGSSGEEVPGDRSLSYFIAHEVAHTMTVRHTGRLAYWRLEQWQQEGYADYVARAGAFDFEEMLAAYRRGDARLDPERSGLYLRYQLMVESLLRQIEFAPAQLVKAPISGAEVERSL